MKKRTTILADPELLLDARHLAEQQGTTFTALVQDALRAYVAAHRKPRKLPTFVGMGESSGEPVPWDRLDELLIEGLDPIEGWSPDRSALVEPASSSDSTDRSA